MQANDVRHLSPLAAPPGDVEPPGSALTAARDAAGHGGRTLSIWRHQLAAYSPITGAAVLRAALREAASDPASLDALASLLAREHAATHVSLLGSGTQALQVAIEIAAAARSPSHSSRPPTVALPAFTCFDVASAAIGADVPLRLYDVRPGDLQPDLESLEGAVRAGAKVVVVAPLYGVPIDWDALDSCLAPHDVVVIEDAAQGSGASWRGRAHGSLGALSVVSFGRGKGWTGGGGGALLVHDRDLVGLARQRATRTPPSRGVSRLAVAAAVQWMLGRPSTYALPRALPWLALGRTTYRAPVTPYGMTCFSAALLLVTREAALAEVRQRQSTGQVLEQALMHAPGIERIRMISGSVPGYLRYPFLASANQRAPGLRARSDRLGIEASYPAPLADLAVVGERMEGERAAFAGASLLARRLFTAPTHSRLTSEDLSRVITLLSSPTWLGE